MCSQHLYSLLENICFIFWQCKDINISSVESVLASQGHIVDPSSVCMHIYLNLSVQHQLVLILVYYILSIKNNKICLSVMNQNNKLNYLFYLFHLRKGIVFGLIASSKCVWQMRLKLNFYYLYIYFTWSVCIFRQLENFKNVT